jgi:hypothetical protein
MLRPTHESGGRSGSSSTRSEPIKGGRRWVKFVRKRKTFLKEGKPRTFKLLGRRENAIDKALRRRVNVTRRFLRIRPRRAVACARHILEHRPTGRERRTDAASRCGHDVINLADQRLIIELRRAKCRSSEHARRRRITRTCNLGDGKPLFHESKPRQHPAPQRIALGCAAVGINCCEEAVDVHAGRKQTVGQCVQLIGMGTYEIANERNRLTKVARAEHTERAPNRRLVIDIRPKQRLKFRATVVGRESPAIK